MRGSAGVLGAKAARSSKGRESDSSSGIRAISVVGVVVGWIRSEGALADGGRGESEVSGVEGGSNRDSLATERAITGAALDGFVALMVWFCSLSEGADGMSAGGDAGKDSALFDVRWMLSTLRGEGAVSR
jgi:hypothetical protein